jgi:hypothetical protein
MLAELDRAIHASRERLRHRDRLLARHTELSDRLESLLAELTDVKRRLAGERAAQLDRAAVTSRRLVAGLQTRKDQLLADLRELKGQLAEVEFAPQEYEDALLRKERLLSESNDPRAVELLEIADRLADVEAELGEHDAACAAGTNAISALNAIRHHLNNAHASATWGLLASSAANGDKNDHLEAAEGAGRAAQQALAELGRTLARIPVAVGPRVRDPGALWFVDMFYDDFVTRMIRSQSIAETYDQMEEMIEWISALVDRLRPQSADLAEACAALRTRRRELLEPDDPYE